MMKCKTITLLTLLCLLIPITFTKASIHYTANTYPFTFPTYGTAMGFDADQTLNTAYRTSEIWYFNTSTVNLIGFQVQVANLLVTDFFATDPDILEFRVTASSGTSTTKIWVGTRGEPSDVLGETSWSYDAGTKICTITRTHASSYDIEVDWVAGGDSEAPTYSNVAHNTTTETQICKFSSYWDDNIALSHYIPSSNETGSWVNGTTTAFGSTPSWANFTKTLPASGTVVGYRWYANDTSDNWATTPIYTLTTTAIGENIVVLLNAPSDGATSYTNATTFTYTPVFYSTIQNASVWANVSGTWQAIAWNASTVGNNTANSITYSFTDSGIYIWNIAVYNTTHAIFAATNRTLTKSLEPYYTNIAYSTTIINTPCTLSIIAKDGDGLSGYILKSNVTGAWLNDTWTATSGTEQTIAEIKNLPTAVGVKVAFLWYLNDTDNKWLTAPTVTFTTAFGPPTPSLYVDPLASLWQFLTEGDLLGMLSGFFVMVFSSADIFFTLVTMIILGAIYIRTHSLALIGILWILVGSVFIAVMPMVAGVGVLFVILGVGSLLLELWRSRTPSY